MLRSDLCDYNGAYNVERETIDLLAAAANENDKPEKGVVFKNNAPFRSCISNINSTLIDNAEDFDIVMPMYNLLEYSQNYYMTSRSLWNYYRDEIDNVDDNASDDTFTYKTKIVGDTPESTENEVTIPLKYLSNFWRSLDLPFINREMNLFYRGQKVVY